MSSRLARFAAITALAFVLSRLLGLVRDQVIAWRFGDTNQFDAYVLAFQIPDTLFILVSGGALGTAFIPVFTGLLHSGDEEAAWRMAYGVMVVLGAGLVVLIAVTWIFAPALMSEGLARRDAPETRTLATGLMRVLLFSPLLLAMGSIATAILQSFDQFGVAAFAPAAYNVGIIGGALFIAPLFPDGYGMYGVATGVLVGTFFFLALQLPLTLRLGLRRFSTAPLRDPNVRTTLRLLFPRILGQSAIQISTLITFFLAAGLAENGPTAYRLAFTLFVLPVGLFATSVGTVAFPSMSREAEEADTATFSYLLRRSMRAILFFVLPGSVGLALLRLPITKLIYQHGEFSAQGTELTANTLAYFCLGMWAYALLDIVPRAFYAMQDTRTPVLIALGVVVLDVALSFLLGSLIGLGGLALAFAIASMVQVIALLFALNHRTGFTLDPNTLRFGLKAAAATMVMAATVLLAGPLWRGYQTLGTVELLLRLGAVICAAAGAYLLVSLLLKQEEIGTLRRIVRR